MSPASSRTRRLVNLGLLLAGLAAMTWTLHGIATLVPPEASASLEFAVQPSVMLFSAGLAVPALLALRRTRRRAGAAEPAQRVLLAWDEALEVARIDRRWDEFVVEGKGIRCIDHRPWVTGAETSELALARISTERTPASISGAATPNRLGLRVCAPPIISSVAASACGCSKISFCM